MQQNFISFNWRQLRPVLHYLVVTLADISVSESNSAYDASTRAGSGWVWHQTELNWQASGRNWAIYQSTITYVSSPFTGWDLLIYVYLWVTRNRGWSAALGWVWSVDRPLVDRLVDGLLETDQAEVDIATDRHFQTDIFKVDGRDVYFKFLIQILSPSGR